MAYEQKLTQVVEFLEREGEGALRVGYNATEDADPATKWMVGMEWGREEPDNPDNEMAGAAAYGTGETLEEALTELLVEAGVE